MSLPRLPDWVGLPNADGGGLQGGGRQSVTATNRLSELTVEQDLNISAQGLVVPLAYGRVRIAGSIYAIAKSGTDLVLGIGWCVGEIGGFEAIYINDEPASPGVTITNYLGTATQPVDPTLAALIPAYADSLRIELPAGAVGIAHSVITIPESAVEAGWPRVEAVINGRKIFDPRDSTTAVSDNPALIARDVASNPVFGAGLAVDGVEECADWCDSLIGGALPRCRAALVLGGAPIDQLLALLSDYGEFFVSVDGSTVALVPDAPVDTPALTVYDDGSIVADSLEIAEASAQDTPTVCEVTITEPTADETPWRSVTVSASTPGVLSGDVPRVPTALRLPGVYRADEGLVKAVARLAKLRHRRSIRFVTTDRGITAQRGDVVRVQSDAKLAGHSMEVRVMSVWQRQPGRWAVEAINYDADHYPTAYESEGAEIPEGLILPLAGTSPPPPGWSVFSDADGSLIVGAGGELAPGESAPATAETVTLSGWTSEDGSHGGPSGFPLAGQRGGSGVGAVWPGLVGGHRHSFSMPPATPYAPQFRQRLAIKTGGETLSVPPELLIFGIQGDVPGLALVARGNAAVLAAAGTPGEADPADYIVTFTTGQANDYHNHVGQGVGAGPIAGWREPCYSPGSSGGTHTHDVEAYARAYLIRRRVPLYTAAGPYGVVPGMIGMWAGDLASIPDDWTLCDGTNGTPDLVDFFVEAASESNAGTAAGTGAVSATIVGMSEVGHSHTATVSYPAIQAANQYHSGHSDIKYHRHQSLIPDSIPAWKPARFALAFIMYAPGV